MRFTTPVAGFHVEIATARNTIGSRNTERNAMTNKELLSTFFEAAVQFVHYSNPTAEAAFVAARDAILARLDALDECVKAMDSGIKLRRSLSTGRAFPMDVWESNLSEVTEYWKRVESALAKNSKMDGLK